MLKYKIPQVVTLTHTKYAKEHYELIRTYIEYMGFDSDSVLRMVEKPDSILKVIDGMK